MESQGERRRMRVSGGGGWKEKTYSTCGIQNEKKRSNTEITM